MSKDITARQAADRSFEGKIRLAKWASVFEQLWLRLWSIAAVGLVFTLVTLSGAWAHLNDGLHIALLAVFGLAVLAATIYIARIKWPAREDAIRRIERVSGIPHRPASSYEDTLTASASDPTTRAIWQAHKARMAEAMSKLKPGRPKPRTDTRDPLALRALLTLGAVAALALAGDRTFERLGSAFQFSSFTRLAQARLDAWVTPPAYTTRPPLMLADGSNPLGSGKAVTAASTDVQPLSVPDRSVVILRASGIGTDTLSLVVSTPGTEPETFTPLAKEAGNDVQEIRYILRRGATLRALAGTTEVAKWSLDVIPDQVPKIALTKKPELTPRGSLKLIYKVEDDYGVASAGAHVEKVKPKDTDPAIAWSQPPAPKGARPPLTRPPVLTLKVPHGTPKEAEATTYLDLASHPWAGMRVKMNLEVKDVAGQVGATVPVEMVLPARAFTKPLARAVVEQRRKLIDDPRYRDQVMIALDALTAKPQEFIKDQRVYLSLRTIYHRLGRDRSRQAMASVVEQMWQTALRIEDGDLSEAERALRDAQERLSKALEDGASEEEIKRLMDEMKQAFNDYMQQLAKQSEKDNEQAQQDGNGDQEKFGKQELDEMMKKFEEAAKNGSREDAEKMLSELRDVMERLKAGKSEDQQAQQQRSQELQKMMEKLVNMASEQQKLLDDTFKEQQSAEGKDPVEQRSQQPGANGQKSGKGKDGKKVQRSSGDPKNQARADKGHDGERQQGDDGQDGEDDTNNPQSGGQGNKSPSSLADRQRKLKERLAELEKQMKDARAGGSKELRDARDAMESAEQALSSSDLDDATENQGDALEKMRESAQQMSEQMQKQASRGTGENGKKERDPLGRPQKTQGPDLGTSVKVPDQIDAQRAREVLEEVRRRLGEPTRPEGELDYLERLQKRF
ncbi:MAG: TIGR02302 family protein [Hyphomicrobium sp.]